MEKLPLISETDTHSYEVLRKIKVNEKLDWQEQIEHDFSYNAEMIEYMFENTKQVNEMLVAQSEILAVSDREKIGETVYALSLRAEKASETVKEKLKRIVAAFLLATNMNSAAVFPAWAETAVSEASAINGLENKVKTDSENPDISELDGEYRDNMRKIMNEYPEKFFDFFAEDTGDYLGFAKDVAMQYFKKAIFERTAMSIEKIDVLLDSPLKRDFIQGFFEQMDSYVAKRIDFSPSSGTEEFRSKEEMMKYASRESAQKAIVNESFSSDDTKYVAMLGKYDYFLNIAKSVIDKSDVLSRWDAIRAENLTHAVLQKTREFRLKILHFNNDTKLTDVLSQNAIIQKEDFPLQQDVVRKFFQRSNHGRALHKDEFQPFYDMDAKVFNEVFFSSGFQNVLMRNAGKMTYGEAFSLAESVWFELPERAFSVSGEQEFDNIVQETFEILLETRERLKSVEIITPNATSVVMIHTDREVTNPLLAKSTFLPEVVSKKGKKVIVVEGMKFENEKNSNKILILDSIRNAKEPLRIFFFGHGMQDAWYFSDERPGDGVDENSFENENKIMAQEMASALAQSKSKDIVFMSYACFSNNFYRGVISELENIGAPLPKLMISESGLNRLGYANSLLGTTTFMKAIAHVDSHPITFGDFLNMERAGFLGDLNDLVYIFPKKRSAQETKEGKSSWMQMSDAEKYGTMEST